MEQKLPITKITIERIGTKDAFIRKWYEGWNEADAGPCNIETYEQNVNFYNLLDTYKEQGYTVWVDGYGLGHALKGRITRIDILKCGEVWKIKKYPYGWRASTPALETKEINEQELDQLIKWLKEKKWNVFEFQSKDRFLAFKGKARPINDKRTILSLRRKAIQQKVNYFVDFAFYPTG
ncbi:MAG TPA: hypothetical protein DIW23_05730 [Anaerolineae bacterium]|mgnify:CR=1 FL=1|nr:hypothetical protein [Anaerolineae bacterium]